MKMVRYGSVFVLAMLLMSSAAFGQILTFEFSALAGSEVSAASNFNDANLTSSSISRGAGVTAGANAQRFNSTGWTTGALDATDYVEFTITPNSGKKFSITSVVMQHQRSGTGPRDFAIRSSIDSYAANLATATVGDVTTTATATFTFSQNDVVTATTYRIYAYTSESAAGTWGPGDGTGDDITVNGSTGDNASAEPTVQASSVNFGSIGTNGLTVNWTNGDGASRIVVMKSGSAVDSPPVDNTGYTANALFGSGTQIGTGNYVVYSGTGSSIAVTGLSSSTTYHIAVYEFNGSAGGSNYLTTSPATGNQATIAPSGDAISNITTANNEQNNIDYASKQAASITATTDAVRVWSFSVQDGGGSTDGDALTTELTSITIGKGGSNSVTSWANTIRRAALYDGSTEIAEIDVTGETMSFSSLSGANVTAPDDDIKTIDLYLTFETATTDNIQYQFAVTSASAGASGSLFASVDAGAAASDVTGDANRVEVSATKLLFVQQPSTVNTNTSISPAVTVEAVDGNNLRDLDYATSVSMTATGATLTGSPVSATPASGLTTFSTLAFSTAGTGVTITAASGSLSNATSNGFTINAAPVTHTLPYTEDFSYSTGQLTSASSGANVSSSKWVNVSGTSNYVQVSSGSLSKSGYSAGTGGKMELTDTGVEDVRANFTAQSADGTKLYTAFLINVTNVTGLSAGGDYFAHYSNVNGVTNPGFHARTYIRSSAGGFQFGIVANSGGTTQWTTTEYTAGNTYLVIIGYEIVAGTTNNISRLWVDPVLSGSPPASDLTSVATVEPDLLDAFGFRQAADTPNASIDGMFISAGWSAPLPVELVSFTASVNGRSVELAWKTATEVNNAGFEIERNVNGSWNKIGYVEGNGTTNAPKSYSYTDASVKGSVSYRLKQVDTDGKFEYSNVVEVSAGITAADYQLSQNFPNPFNPTTNITFAMKNAEHVNVTVYNALGQVVATLFNDVASANQLYTLNFDGKDLSSGTYFYSLRSATRNEVRKMSLMK